MNETEVVQRLRQLAVRLTGDVELRKDLVQEMHLHLMKAQTRDPGRSWEWYLKGCEFRARNYLKLGRSIDSLKRARQAVPWQQTGDGHGAFTMDDTLADAGKPDLRVELMTAEIVQMVAQQLTPRQQQTLELLMKGCGVRETARRLGISHPAVIKHRRKISRLTAALLDRGRSSGVTRAPARQFAGALTG